MIRAERLLNPSSVPETLWQPNSNILFIPPALAKSYATVIDRNGLRSLSEMRTSEEGPVGGRTKALTDQHFAQAFDGSMARMELALLDPLLDATPTSNALILSLAGNTLCLTDAPCGSGAAAFTLLATIAELRANQVLPRLPLDILLIGAEISAPARIYAAEILSELRPSLEEQGIFVEEDFRDWDVSDPLSNTDLISKVTLKAAKASRRLLVVANFNGFLEKYGKRKQAAPQISELFRHSSGMNSVAIWLEPDMNRATGPGGLFQWLRDSTATVWNRFARKADESTEDKPVCTCSARFALPLRPHRNARVGLAVMRIDLVRADL